MRRLLNTGILSTAVIAASASAHAQAQVYSVNVVSLHSAGCHWGYQLGPSRVFFSAVGPFGAQEIAYWTDASGRVLNNLNRPDQPSDKRHVRTGICLGPVSFHLPLSPRWSAATILASLLVLGCLVMQFLLRRSPARRHEPAGT